MSQVGTALETTATPLLTKFIVVRDTWQETDNTQSKVTEADTGTINVAFWDDGADIKCDVVVKDNQTPAAKGDVITELTPGSRKWLVMDAVTKEYGSKPLMQSLSLLRKTTLTLT